MQQDFIDLARNNPVDALITLAACIADLEAKLTPTEPAAPVTGETTGA